MRPGSGGSPPIAQFRQLICEMNFNRRLATRAGRVFGKAVPSEAEVCAAGIRIAKFRQWLDNDIVRSTSPSKLFRPFLTAMKNRNEFQTFVSNSVRDDIRRIGNNQLARADNSARPANLRLTLQKLNAFKNALCNDGGVFRTVCSDVVP
jgi:hypothetical protein